MSVLQDSQVFDLVDIQGFVELDIQGFDEVDILVSDPKDTDQEFVQVADTGLVSHTLGIVEDSEVSGRLVSDQGEGTQESGLDRLGCDQVSAGVTPVSEQSGC